MDDKIDRFSLVTDSKEKFGNIEKENIQKSNSSGLFVFKKIYDNFKKTFFKGINNDNENTNINFDDLLKYLKEENISKQNIEKMIKMIKENKNNQKYNNVKLDKEFNINDKQDNELNVNKQDNELNKEQDNEKINDNKLDKEQDNEKINDNKLDKELDNEKINDNKQDNEKINNNKEKEVIPKVIVVKQIIPSELEIKKELLKNHKELFKDGIEELKGKTLTSIISTLNNTNNNIKTTVDQNDISDIDLNQNNKNIEQINDFDKSEDKKDLIKNITKNENIEDFHTINSSIIKNTSSIIYNNNNLTSTANFNELTVTVTKPITSIKNNISTMEKTVTVTKPVTSIKNNISTMEKTVTVTKPITSIKNNISTMEKTVTVTKPITFKNKSIFTKEKIVTKTIKKINTESLPQTIDNNHLIHKKINSAQIKFSDMTGKKPKDMEIDIPIEEFQEIIDKFG